MITDGISRDLEHALQVATEHDLQYAELQFVWDKEVGDFDDDQMATALALVCNELVQNALEHAFTEQTAGQIEISLGHSPDEYIVLVRDDGRGLDEAFERGSGLEIAETLVRDDLDGRMKYNRLPRGTEISIRFPRKKEAER